MKIYKFGGASVKDASGVRNVAHVIRETQEEPLLIVVSAMGKTTNALEQVIHDYFNNQGNITESIKQVIQYHAEILAELFPADHSIHQKIKDLFEALQALLSTNRSSNYDYLYDQVVSYGEIISSTILQAYLEEENMDFKWLDARELIKTDANYRDANVNWEATKQEITKAINPTQNYITQGFLGAEMHNFTTTLGREGSDYSAAIFAYCLDATSLTIWKDVAGVLNADPRYFTHTVLLEQISYREAIEFAFYGASVIHPKTLQPLQQKEIPFYVKSFIDPQAKGTTVSKGVDLYPKQPCFIVKKNQQLLSISSKDFSFIMEEGISFIFSILHQHKLKVHLIQNTAISFSVCLEDKFGTLNQVIDILSEQFSVHTKMNVTLYTIRHFTSSAEASITSQHEVLLKQTTAETLQIITA